MKRHMKENDLSEKPEKELMEMYPALHTSTTEEQETSVVAI